MLISFDEIIEVTLEHEGGYVHDLKDLGGETNSNVSLEDLSDGTVDTINTDNSAANRPNGSAPHYMSEFYSYDHDTSGNGNSNGNGGPGKGGGV